MRGYGTAAATDPATSGATHDSGNRQVSCGLLRPVTVMLISCALSACATSPRSSSELAIAEIDTVRFVPGAGAVIPPQGSVSAYFEYRIASTDSADTADTLYYAVLEARSADARHLYLDACGRDARRTLRGTVGSISLSCAVRLAAPVSDDEALILQVRIYQRTDERHSVTIGSSRPVSLRRARAIFTPLQKRFMPRCNDPAGPDDRARAAVMVCRG